MKPEGKRTLRARSQDLIEMMEDRGIEPELFLGLVVKGDEPPNRHPFLDWLMEYDKETLGGHPPNVEQWALILERAQKELSQVPATLDQRITAAKDLMPYLYPKLQSVQHSGGVNVGFGVLRIPAPPVDEKTWSNAAVANQKKIEETIDADFVNLDKQE